MTYVNKNKKRGEGLYELWTQMWKSSEAQKNGLV